MVTLGIKIGSKLYFLKFFNKNYKGIVHHFGKKIVFIHEKVNFEPFLLLKVLLYREYYSVQDRNCILKNSC